MTKAATETLGALEPFDRAAAHHLELIARIAFTGEPTPGIEFSEELQEMLLIVLDEVFDSEPLPWLQAVTRFILCANKVGLTPSEALYLWANAHVSKLATEYEEFA